MQICRGLRPLRYQRPCSARSSSADLSATTECYGRQHAYPRLYGDRRPAECHLTKDLFQDASRAMQLCRGVDLMVGEPGYAMQLCRGVDLMVGEPGYAMQLCRARPGVYGLLVECCAMSLFERS